MAKKNRKPEMRLFPLLHQEVVHEVSGDIGEPWFNENNNERAIKVCSTSIRAKFVCYNSKCPNQVWRSGMVAILIKGYGNNGYTAEVYSQRCERCEQLGSMKLDKQSYVDRVAYRLKKWAGVQQEQPPYRQKNTPPHKSWLCEGYKRGICRKASV